MNHFQLPEDESGLSDHTTGVDPTCMQSDGDLFSLIDGADPLAFSMTPEGLSELDLMDEAGQMLYGHDEHAHLLPHPEHTPSPEEIDSELSIDHSHAEYGLGLEHLLGEHTDLTAPDSAVHLDEHREQADLPDPQHPQAAPGADALHFGGHYIDAPVYDDQGYIVDHKEEYVDD
jgi:hypothetical protein